MKGLHYVLCFNLHKKIFDKYFIFYLFIGLSYFLSIIIYLIASVF